MQGYKDGIFLKDPENRGKAPGNPMTDPAAMEGMMGMMKGNMMMMIPQTVIMGWINAFFAGFVISKYPDGSNREIVLSQKSRDSSPPATLLTRGSETTLSPYHSIQVHASIRRGDARS